MTLHENLETKRRCNIAELNKSGACHLCECTSGARSYRRFIGNDDDENGGQQEGTKNQVAASSVLPSDIPMRMCMCHGNTTEWPYPLKVCEVCIADDQRSSTGRIRSCGICGVVACDENCGVELVEVTDRDEWNNEGCLECRSMESFSEMELFRRKPYPRGVPRAMRVCTSCLELFSLFSFGKKYQFKCRYFKCNHLLVPSHIVELKRSMTPFPLSELPMELLDSIIDMLGGKDLFSFGLVCTSMFRKVEDVSKNIVTRWNHTLPTGPTQIFAPDEKRYIHKTLVYAEGKNRHSLSAPEDGKTWVGVLNQMEQLTRDIFYIDFQIKGGDDGAAMRYLRNPNKLFFNRTYSKSSGTGAITPYFDDNGGLTVRGGHVLVTKYKWHHSAFMEELEVRNNIRSIIFSTDKVLRSGIHRVIVRYYCFCDGESLGSIGILRKTSPDGSSVSWAQTSTMACQNRMEEHVFGMEYNADTRKFQIWKKNARTNKMETTTPDERGQTIADEAGSLCFAAALSMGSLGIKNNQLSIRECREDEWSAFLAHKAEKNIIPTIRGHTRRGQERLMRLLDHRARRTMAIENDDNDHAVRVQIEHMMDGLMEEEFEALNEPDSDLEDAMNVDHEPPAVAAEVNP
mmetsp:Transcript_39973/g.96192  ORF Transcript_39973/g.96192 Transcript_39973/m.96192 type:complete len:628 (-) Transcript_39973:460-2343(-)